MRQYLLIIAACKYSCCCLSCLKSFKLVDSTALFGIIESYSNHMTTRQQGQTVSQFTYLTTLLAAVSQLINNQTKTNRSTKRVKSGAK